VKIIRISVLLPVCEEPHEWVKQSIDSILNQTFRDVELIILLDNPANASLTKFIQQHFHDDRIKIVANEQNIGLAKTLNKGISLARGSYIARMDADDIALPNRLKTQYEFMEQHPDVSLCGCRSLKIDQHGDALKRSACYDPALITRIIRYSNVISHPTWMLQKKVYGEMGGYRNFPNAQDYDFVFRLLEKGRIVKILPDILLHQRIHIHSQAGKRSLRQKVCFEYIQELARERRRSGNDSFSESIINDRLKEMQNRCGDQQNRAQAYLVRSFRARSNRRFVKQWYYVVRSTLASPIQRRYFLNLFKREVVILFNIPHES